MYVLDLSLLPESIEGHWNLQVDISPKALYQIKDFHFPYPIDGPNQKVKNIYIDSSTPYHEEFSEAGHLLYWNESPRTDSTLRYTSTLQLQEYRAPRIRRERQRPTPRSVEVYLEVPKLSSELNQLILELENAIFFPEDDRLERVRKIYYYISEEVRINSSIQDLTEALSLGEGASRITRARLFTLLARRNKIPTRTVFAVRVNSQSKITNALYLTALNEFYINSQWYPVDLGSRSFGVIHDNYIILYKDLDAIEESLFTDTSLYSFYAEPVKINQLNTLGYTEDLKGKPSLLTRFSLYHLPLSLQSMFYTILLIPFGAVILSFARNIIGVNTFGIFTPVLLTLFFVETSFLIGFVFFLLVVALGFTQRYLLDRFHLLAVPRLSILLTLVIITFTGFIIFNNDYRFFSSPQATLGYFPIVIITVFIERFSVYFIEEGTLNTLKTLAGTFLVSVLCYLIFMFDLLKIIIFTHPELLLIAIALNIMIGSYKGYRLSEAFRFQDFSKVKTQ